MNGLRVLWAEDSLQDQLLIRSALDEDAWPHVEFAGDGVLLLEAVARSLPDLVVLDLKMPRMGGIETLRALRSDARTAQLPVCIFSAGNQPKETAACQELGALAVVQKPVDYGHFTAAVQQILKRVPTVAAHGR